MEDTCGCDVVMAWLAEIGVDVDKVRGFQVNVPRNELVTITVDLIPPPEVIGALFFPDAKRRG